MVCDPSALETPVNFANVQGNIIGGFLKDHQVLVFGRFGEMDSARQWLDTMADQLATAEDVTSFNALYSHLRGRFSTPPVQATWINLALTPAGVQKLAPQDFPTLPAEFTADITQRAVDTLADPPANLWDAGLQNPGGIDVLIIIASDDVDELNVALDVLATGMDDAGVTEVHREHGTARVDDPGHEHFGYKDGCLVA